VPFCIKNEKKWSLYVLRQHSVYQKPLFFFLRLFILSYAKFIYYLRFEVFTAVTVKNAVFCDVAPCKSCVNRRFGGKYHLHLQGREIRERRTSVSSLQPPAHAGSSLADFSTLKMEVIRCSETSVHTRSTRRHIPEDSFLQLFYQNPSVTLWALQI
jgi:hypothetical protein